jgi:hypothetical protein
LAVFAKPRGPNAPAPIRVASAVEASPPPLSTLLSSVAAKAREIQSSDEPHKPATVAGVAERESTNDGDIDPLSKLERLEDDRE